MEFNEKLQELRKKNNFSQEQLAEKLFVSRAAISKWESGRGYPNIDSLKRMSKLFSVSIDELLSGDELLSLAEEDSKRKANNFKDLVFALFDISVLLLLFLPFFAQRVDGVINDVSLIYFTNVNLFIQFVFYTFVIISFCFGIFTLVLQNSTKAFWLNFKNKISIIINIIGVIIFIVSLQPYAAIFVFVFLIIKIMILIKKY